MKTSTRVILVAGILLATVGIFQNCSPVAFQQSDVASLGELPGISPVSPESPRCTFDGQQYAEGQTVVAYQSSTVPYGQSCASEVRTCHNGAFTGSYAYSQCNAGSAGSCLFNGQTIAHGGKVTAYASSSVAYGGTCASQERVCNNGALSGIYAFASCSVGAAKSCLFNGQTVSHGQSVVAYAQPSVAYGQACASQTRACNNGVLSGSYTNSSCVIASKPQGPVCTVVANPSVLRPFVQSGNKCVTSNYSFTFSCDKDITKKPNGFRVQINSMYKDGTTRYYGSSYYSQDYYSATGLYPGSNPMVLPASAFTMNGPRSLTISAEFLLRSHGVDESIHPVYGCNSVQRYDLKLNFYVGEQDGSNPRLFIDDNSWPALSMPAN